MTSISLKVYIFVLYCCLYSIPLPESKMISIVCSIIESILLSLFALSLTFTVKCQCTFTEIHAIFGTQLTDKLRTFTVHLQNLTVISQYVQQKYSIT